MMKYYRAPWSKGLLGMSAFGTAIFLGISLWLILDLGILGRLIGLPLLVFWLACLLFMIRGYTLRTDTILVHRLFWKTRLPVADLTSVEVIPHAMKKSTRTCGNHGLFSYSGYFQNERIGEYRALVTDFTRTTLLRFKDGAVIISPDDPSDFARDANQLIGTLSNQRPEQIDDGNSVKPSGDERTP